MRLIILLCAVIGLTLASRYGTGRRAYRPARRIIGRGGSIRGGNVVGVNGYWGSWGVWSACDKKCGGGYKSRTRVCHKPQYVLYGNGDCRGSGTERKPCHTHHCKVDGYWSDWTSYGTCSKHCGGGYRTKTRLCNKPAPAYGGADCYGPSSYTESCNPHHCSVHGGWSEWGVYGDCSATCGAGHKYKYRTCTNPAPLYGGNDCYGASSYSESCTGYHCKVDGYWSAWASYGSCSKHCGGGYRTKTRECNSPAPAYGGADCYGASSYTETCNTHYCPTHGGWSEWGVYGECSSKCGNGHQYKYRTCTKPAPAYGGNDCVGAASYSISCTGYHCPQPGGWSGWTSYGSCSKKCGGGYRTKTRQCNNPAPLYGGAHCIGGSSYTESCNSHYCKVHGGWDNWGHWTPCSGTCGTGISKRTRHCNNPAPAYGGNSCYGSGIESKVCHHSDSCYGSGGYRTGGYRSGGRGSGGSSGYRSGGHGSGYRG